jgi:hypothetical protein
MIAGQHHHQTLASSNHHNHPEEVTDNTPLNFTIQEVWRQFAPISDEKLCNDHFDHIQLERFSLHDFKFCLKITSMPVG